MMSVRHRDWRPALRVFAIALGLSITIPAIASAKQANASAQSESREVLLERIAQSGKRLGEAASGSLQANSDFIITIKWKGYSR
jgi:hypothetical protein